MHIGRARRHELPPPRRGRVGVGVTLKNAAEGAPLPGWRRLPASVQAIGRASTPRPPPPAPPPRPARAGRAAPAGGGGGVWGGRRGARARGGGGGAGAPVPGG